LNNLKNNMRMFYTVDDGWHKHYYFLEYRYYVKKLF
jgi:hypothetical protein